MGAVRPPSVFWRDDERARAAFSEAAGIYRIVPSAVAVPSTSASLQQLVRWAHETATPLVPRGAGSGMAGGNVGEGVVVDLTVLDGAPLRVDPRRKLAIAGTATTLGAINETAGSFQLRLAPDPSSARWATCGGAVSTNAAGARSVRAGSVRRWVRALTVITVEGERVRLRRGGPNDDAEAFRRFYRDVEPAIRAANWRIASSYPKARKNVAGYALDAFLQSGDLLDLFIGAEGTLGLVTEVEWELESEPLHRVGLRAALRDARRLSQCVPALLELNPSSLEFLDGSFLAFAREAAGRLAGLDAVSTTGALLMVEFEGDEQGQLRDLMERAEGILRPECVDLAVGTDSRATEALWEIRHAASPLLANLGERLRSLQVVEDGCVPVDRVGEYLAALKTAAAQHGVAIVLFGHAGDGHIHANLLPDVTQWGWERAIRAVYAEVTDAIFQLGGTPTGEHGDGRIRAPTLDRLYGPEIVRLFQLMKAAFDPRGILNPGVKLSAAADPLSNLKVGPQVVPLPRDIEAGLRAVEQQAGYAVDRLALADRPLAG